MFLKELITQGWQSLMRNRLRSLLTMLGIVWGLASVVLLLATLLPWHPWLRKLWVDGGYSGEDFAHWVKCQRANLDVEVVKRSDQSKGFQLLAKRWIVERTFAWLNQFRRLRVRYEKRSDIHGAFLSLGCALICWRFLRTC